MRTAFVLMGGMSAFMMALPLKLLALHPAPVGSGAFFGDALVEGFGVLLSLLVVRGFGWARAAAGNPDREWPFDGEPMTKSDGRRIVLLSSYAAVMTLIGGTPPGVGWVGSVWASSIVGAWLMGRARRSLRAYRSEQRTRQAAGVCPYWLRMGDSGWSGVDR